MPLYTTPNARAPRNIDEYPASLGSALSASFFGTIDDRIGEYVDSLNHPFMQDAMRYVAFAETGILQPRPQRKDIVSKDEANQEGQQYGLKYHFDTTKAILDHDIARERERIAREELIKRGPSGGWAQGAYMVTPFVAGMIDPINIASSFIPVAGPAARIAGISEKALTASLRNRVLAASFEGAVGNLVTEPVEWAMLSAQHRDYTLGQTMNNFVLGGLMGGTFRGLHETAKFGLEKIGARVAEKNAHDAGQAQFQENMRAAERANVPAPSEKFDVMTDHERVTALQAQVAGLENDMRPVGGESVMRAVPEQKLLPGGDANALPDKRQLLSMNASELAAYEVALKKHIRQIEDEVLGPELAKEVRRRDRNGTLDQIESQLTPEQWAVVYGTDPRIPDENFVRELTKAKNNISLPDNLSEDEVIHSLVFELKWAADHLPESLANATDKELIAYAQFREALMLAEERGVDKTKFTNALVQAIADRHTDPEDARFIVEEMFRKVKAAAAEAQSPPPTRGDAVEPAALKEVASDVKDAMDSPRARLFGEQSELSKPVDESAVLDMNNPDAVVENASTVEAVMSSAFDSPEVQRVLDEAKPSDLANMGLVRTDKGVTTYEIQAADNALAAISKFQQAHEKLINCLANGGGI